VYNISAVHWTEERQIHCSCGWWKFWHLKPWTNQSICVLSLSCPILPLVFSPLSDSSCSLLHPFHPSIPLSPQSRRQQDPSPGSNMANADVEHKMRWGGQGRRKRSGKPGLAVCWLSTQSAEKKSQMKPQSQTYCCALFPDRFDTIAIKCQTFFHCMNVRSTSWTNCVESE